MQKRQQLTDKELVILRYFYKERKGYVRQIKKSINISEHTLLKYLNSLEKNKILASRKEGNLKIYEINLLNQFTKLFFAYFDLQRIEALEYKRRKAIREFSEKLKNIKIPYFILLFGSTAKDNYISKSDIDLIVVYDSVTKPDLTGINNLKRKILAETGIKINAIIMKLKEFNKEKINKENYPLQDALQYGYPVFGNQLYYEVVLG